jgi:hypothetical protein
MDQLLAEAREMGQSLIDRPLYVVTPHSDYLSDMERRLIFTNCENTLAFTSPVADVLFREGALRYEWSGRGCCVAFRNSPVIFSPARLNGILVHEIGHWVACCNEPCRDNADTVQAAVQFFMTMKTEAEYHDHRWLRATVHLWHRACRMGYEIPFNDVLNLEQYGYNLHNLAPLLDEASARETEPLERILGSTTRQSKAKQRRRSRTQAIMLSGQCVSQHPDGSITTCPDLYGRGGGLHFDSVRDFSAAQEIQSRYSKIG